jgi:hypothetical protein
MDQDSSESSNGLVIVALRIRNEGRRQEAIDRLENLPSERLTAAIFELRTDDWDEGLWNDEVEWFTELLDGTHDRVIVWKFADGKYTRFTIGS